MKNNGSVAKVVALSLVCIGCLLVWACGTNTVEDDVSEQQLPGFEITEEDERISFTNDAVRVDISQLPGAFEIKDGGDYILSGSGDCRIVVDAKEKPVHLFLDGVRIQGSEGGAVLALSASKLIITCLEGTENVLGDSAYYQENKEYDACLYSVPDLTINGSGSLRITGLYEDGIHSKDIVKILGTTLEVKAKGDGIRGNDGICFTSASGCKVEAEKNGLRTSKNGHDVKGSIEIRDSVVSVIAGKYAIESYDGLVVSGSSLYLNGVLGKWQVAGEEFVEEGNVNGDR